MRSTPEDADEEEGGLFVVRDGEVWKDDLRGLDVVASRIEKEDAVTVGLKEAGMEGKVQMMWLSSRHVSAAVQSLQCPPDSRCVSQLSRSYFATLRTCNMRRIRLI